LATMAELEKRVQQLEIYFKVALMLVAIFGITGYGLWHSLNKAREDAETLTRRVGELDGRTRNIGDTLRKAMKPIVGEAESHIREVAQKERDSLAAAGVAPRLTSLERKLPTRLGVDLNVCDWTPFFPTHDPRQCPINTLVFGYQTRGPADFRLLCCTPRLLP
jgi:hypothetical protein